MEISSKLSIIRYRNGIRSETIDDVVNETELKLAINHKELSSLVCLPDHLEELTAGFLITSGIANEKNGLKGLNYDQEKKIMHIELTDNSVMKDLIFSKMKPVGCGAGTLLFVKDKMKPLTAGELRIRKEKISEMMNQFNRSSELFLLTGGVHSAAISDGNSILVISEDIGRHNAIDKVIGNIYLAKGTLDDKIILTSGRISSEIVLKAVYAGIGMIISRSAPTSRAIEIAEDNGITLIGFARSTNFNIYTHQERVIF
ncbi:MAG: formate dehydrogenase accessory sulfurtransferase FdhD [Candidatus Delongbacteria bacterium]|jgi:FdhD protein|nr:formate dehydrogenase accessory sulfurtransferase FdhD [Candidatus Delongbacteria bacterium]